MDRGLGEVKGEDVMSGEGRMTHKSDFYISEKKSWIGYMLMLEISFIRHQSSYIMDIYLLWKYSREHGLTLSSAHEEFLQNARYDKKFRRLKFYEAILLPYMEGVLSHVQLGGHTGDRLHMIKHDQRGTFSCSAISLLKKHF